MLQSDQVRLCREQYHLSRLRLARLMECSVNQIARIEAGTQVSEDWWERFKQVRMELAQQSSKNRTAKQTQREVQTMLELSFLQEADLTE